MKIPNSIIENILLPLGDLLLKTRVSKELRIQRSFAKMSEQELRSLQTRKLTDLLKHATKTCKAYEGISEFRDPYRWLQEFPIIDKDFVLANGEDLISNKFDKKQLIKYESSGSSGLRSVVYVDKKEQSIFRAILITWWEWNYYYIGKPLLQTGMTPERGIIKKVKDLIFSTMYVNAFSLTENEIIGKLKRLEGKRGYHLFGYASSLYVLAQVAQKHGLVVKFDRAMSQGDKLFNHYKKLIEEVFDTTVVEDYGLNEGIMVGQKKDLPFFYIYTPTVYIEIVDDQGNPLPDGEMGRAIVTKLDGYAMPLVRYDTGDLAVKLPRDQYPEKRDLAFPLLERVVGRNTDLVKTQDGKTLIVHTFTGIFEFYPEIKQFQVVQNELESITILYIPTKDFTPAILEAIEVKFRDRTKSSISIIWEAVEKIEASKSGKPQLIVNNLVKNSLTNVK